MNLEIQEAANAFPNQSIPPQVLRLYEFLTNGKPPGYLDYETIANGKYYLESLLKNNILDELVVFYVDNAHACFSIWRNGESDDLEQLPVVYNDTEGTYSICSRNFGEFLYLLSLNLLPEIVSYWSSFINYPEMGYLHPTEFYSEKKLARAEERNAKNYEDYLPFRDYIQNDLGILTSENPVKIIGDAIAAYPKLTDYIRSKNGFKIDPGI